MLRTLGLAFVGVVSREYVAVLGSQTPTSPTPSPFQSPVTGRLLDEPHRTACDLALPPDTVRSQNVPVLGRNTPTSARLSPSQSPTTARSPWAP